MAKWYVEAIKLPSEERSTIRSRTFQGIADAMADQWASEEIIELGLREEDPQTYIEGCEPKPPRILDTDIRPIAIPSEEPEDPTPSPFSDPTFDDI